MVKIDTSKIEGYEQMTPEQKLAALEGFEYEDNAAEVKRLKEACSKACTDAADWKRKYRTAIAEQNDDQGKESEAVANLMEELSTMRDELTTLRREKEITDYRANFISLGYPDDLATETAAAMADGDSAKVFENQQKFNESLRKSLRAEALKKTPKPVSGGGERQLSVDDIRKMPFREQVEFAQKYPNEYKAAYEAEEMLK